jgi:hypothetical protein
MARVNFRKTRRKSRLILRRTKIDRNNRRQNQVKSYVTKLIKVSAQLHRLASKSYFTGLFLYHSVPTTTGHLAKSYGPAGRDRCRRPLRQSSAQKTNLSISQCVTGPAAAPPMSRGRQSMRRVKARGATYSRPNAVSRALRIATSRLFVGVATPTIAPSRGMAPMMLSISAIRFAII